MQKYISLLTAGASLIFPTETVYGIGADATNPAAVQNMYRIKDRPDTQPTTIFVRDLAAAHPYADFSPTALALAEKYWPGPLTLILPLKKNALLAPNVTCGTNTIGIRIPNDTFILSLLAKFNKPIACTSANKRGEPAPTKHSEITLKNVEIIAGPDLTSQPPSTILDCTATPPKILRQGSIYS